MKYFAYGSNMSLLRLRERTPSAEKIGVFLLKEHQLRFHKKSEDGSAKCDAFQTDNKGDQIIGVIFEISENEKGALDRAEGLGNGYNEKIVNVENDCGETFAALTYYAIKMEPSLKPYSWYLNHVVIGAKQTNVPAYYLDAILAIECIDDPDQKRDAKQRAMYR